MVLVLVTGYALSNSRSGRGELLDRLAGIATTPKRAVVVVVTDGDGDLFCELGLRPGSGRIISPGNRQKNQN